MTRVLVVGSINMDLVTETGVFPRLGETLFGQRFAQYPGGKGANQAVAAARLGAEVTMIGCVGDDVFGAALKDTLNREGVDTRWVRTAPTATGIATIMVCGGDNAIMLVPGANLALTPADLDQAEQAFRDADVVLAQLEVPLPTVEHAAELAHAHGKPFFLNPAPAVPLSAALLARIALLTPNQYELLTVLGMPADGASAADWRDALRATPGRIVMTHGGDGAYYAHADGTLAHCPGMPVAAVDTTGAGDTFSGALAAFWPLGLDEAVRRANAAAALSVTRAGAQSGMPTLTELERCLAAAS